VQPNSYRLSLRHPHDTEWIKDLHKHNGGGDPRARAGSFSGGGASRPIRFEAIEVAFLGGASDRLVQEEVLPYNHNYFQGEDQNHWASDVPVSRAVRMQEVYPGIDLRWYSDDILPKYDWVLAPGADPHSIQMEYTGTRSVQLVQDQLVVVTHYNQWVEEIPLAYQEVDGERTPVPCKFVLDGDVVSFEFPYGYDPTLPLVIDPVLVFSTYTGSEADNWGFTACFDDIGNLYSGGIVLDTGYPVTLGTYQENFNAMIDIGIISYDSIGSSLRYATYIGGSNVELPQSLLVTPDSSLVILGITGSSDYPTTPGVVEEDFQGGNFILTGILTEPFENGTDIVVNKLSFLGNEMIASTYIGGSGNDGYKNEVSDIHFFYGDQFRGDIISDEDGNLFLASITESLDFPVSSGAHQPNYGFGITDAVVVSLTPDLRSFRFSTYLGGSGEDAATSIKLSESGDVLIGGGTNSSDFSGILGGINTVIAGSVDGYATLLRSDGSLRAGTYLGTPDRDQVFFVDYDTAGQVYALGSTFGTYPVLGAVWSVPGSGQFLHQLTPLLDASNWSTVFGSGAGGPDLSPTAFLVNECGNIYLSGWFGPLMYRGGGDFYSPDNSRLPLSLDADQISTDGADFYLTVLNRQASELLFGTYFGENDPGGGSSGDHVDGGTSRFDKRGIVYQSVCASCQGTNGFPTTEDSWSRNNLAGNCNNATFKYDLADIRAAFRTNTPELNVPGISTGCAPFEVFFENFSQGGLEFVWDFGDGTQIVQTEKQDVTHVFDSIGTYRVVLTVIDANTCSVQDSAVAFINATEGNFEVGDDPTICIGEQAQLSASGGVQYVWVPPFGLSDNTSPTPTVSPTQTTTYQLTITDAAGCRYTDSVTVEVIGEIGAAFTSAQTVFCADDNVVTFANLTTNGLDFTWDFGDGTSSTEENPIHEYEQDSVYTVTLTVENEGCEAVYSERVEVEQLLVPTIFTPNGDAYNQTLEIKTTEPVDLAVFDRWGKMKYSAEDYQNTWEAQNLPDGVYYLTVTLPTEEICKGVIHISRD